MWWLCVRESLLAEENRPQFQLCLRMAAEPFGGQTLRLLGLAALELGFKSRCCKHCFWVGLFYGLLDTGAYLVIFLDFKRWFAAFEYRWVDWHEEFSLRRFSRFFIFRIFVWRMDGSAEPQWTGSPTGQGQPTTKWTDTWNGRFKRSWDCQKMIARLGGNFCPSQQFSIMQHVNQRLQVGKSGHGALNNTWLQLTRSSWTIFSRWEPDWINKLIPLTSQMQNVRETASFKAFWALWCDRDPFWLWNR